MKTAKSSLTSTFMVAGITAISVAGYILFRQNKPSTRSIETKEEPSSTNEEKQDIEVKEEEKPASIPAQIDLSAQNSLAVYRRIQKPNTITIAYASTTGTCKGFAESLEKNLNKILAKSECVVTVQACTTDELDWWDELLNNEQEEDSSHSDEKETPPIVIFILRKSCHEIIFFFHYIQIILIFF